MSRKDFDTTSAFDPRYEAKWGNEPIPGGARLLIKTPNNDKIEVYDSHCVVNGIKSDLSLSEIIQILKEKSNGNV